MQFIFQLSTVIGCPLRVLHEHSNIKYVFFVFVWKMSFLHIEPVMIIKNFRGWKMRAQAALDHVILLPQPPKSRDYKCLPLHPAIKKSFTLLSEHGSLSLLGFLLL